MPVAYIEHSNGRIYRIIPVAGFIEHQGHVYRCLADHEQQTVQVSDDLPDSDRSRLLAAAMGNDVEESISWRLVPIVGKALAS